MQEAKELCDPATYDWTWHTARKAGRCHFGGGCRARIAPGDRYVLGEMADGTTNPFVRERYCATHFIPEANRLAALAEGGGR